MVEMRATEPVEAEPPKRPTRPKGPVHSGIYGAIGTGLGYGSGTYATHGFGPSDLYGSFEGGSLNFDIALGYGVLPGVALALEGGLVGQPDVNKTDNRPTSVDANGLTFARVGGMIDGYFTPSFHVQGGADWIHGSWTRMAWVADETPTGLLVHASGGFAWRFFGWDLGPSLRVYRGRLTSDHSDASVFGVSANVNAVWF
jgi:hypothetical protein